MTTVASSTWRTFDKGGIAEESDDGDDWDAVDNLGDLVKYPARSSNHELQEEAEQMAMEEGARASVKDKPIKCGNTSVP